MDPCARKRAKTCSRVRRNGPLSEKRPENPTSNIMLAVRESFQMEGSDLGSDPAAGGGDEVRAEGGWINSSRCSSSRIE